MKIVLIGANGKIGELVQKALAGAAHEIVKVGRKSGDFRVEIENRESVRKLYQAVGSFDAVAIAAGEVAFAPLSELTADGRLNFSAFIPKFCVPGLIAVHCRDRFRCRPLPAS